MIHHITRATRHLIFWSLMALALSLTAIRVGLILVNHYKEELAKTIGAQISAPVSIGSLTTGMRKFRPELVLKNIVVQNIHDPQSKAVSIAEVHLNINLLHSLTHQQILASSWISLVGAHLTLIRQKDGRIGILGLTSDPNQPPPYWLLSTAQVEILNSQIGWMEENTHAQFLFQEVDISLRNTANNMHRINLTTSSPKEFAEKLRISMQLQGNFFEPGHFAGLIYANFQNVQLANAYTKQLPFDLSITDGHGNIEIWSDWRHSSMHNLLGKVQFDQLQLKRPSKTSLLLPQFSTAFKLTQNDQKWALSLDQLRLKSHASQIKNARVAVEGSLTETDNAEMQAIPEIFQVQSQQIELQHLVQLQAFFNPSDLAQSSFKSLRGRLQNIRLQVQPQTQQFAVKGRFEQVSLDANADSPGITNLKGTIQGTEEYGQIRLDSQNSILDLTTVFAKPLPLNSIDALFTWQQTATSWQFDCPKVAITVPDIKVNSRLKLEFDKETMASSIDLTSAFSGASDVASFSRYLPVGTMGKDAANWLNHAFLQGKISPTGVILKGKLSDFPFHNQAGVFQIALELMDVELFYAPGWKPLQKLNGEVLFFQEGMQVVARTAEAKDFKFAQLGMQLKSFETSDELTISGAGKGDLAQVIDYLQESPLKPKLAALQDIINPVGPTDLKLELHIPITDRSSFKLTGSADLKNVGMTVLPLNLPVTKTHGKLEFSEIGITQGILESQVLGDSAKSTLNHDHHKLHLSIAGHTFVDALKEQFSQPLWNFAKGETDYQIKLSLPDSDEQSTKLRLSSDLKGLTLNLPDTLAKQAHETRPFDLSIDFNDPVIVPLRLDYMQQFQAALDFDFKQKHIHSGHFLLGNGQLATAHTDNRVLNVHLNRFSASEWLDLVNTTHTENATPLFNEVHLQTEHLLVQNQDAGPLDLTMHQKNQRWQILANSPLLKGYIEDPISNTDTAPMILDLDYLDLSGLSRLKTAKSNASPSEQLPLFRISSSQVLWDKVNLGKLTLDTRRITNGIEFKKVALQNSHGTLELTGNWIFNAAEQVTTALGKLTLQNFGGFLEQLGLTHNLKESQANIELAVNWAGAPQDFALEKLDGRVDINLKNGRLLSIEPGFGRVLGFLAMEQWGRRLRLDFSDLVAQGLTFNSIVGHFDLQKGHATTDSIKIDSIPANIQLKGSVYLADKTIKLLASVLPKSSAAVPIAGTIVDKILTFAGETVTGTEQEGFLLGSEYKLVGNWQDPDITQLHENDGLLPKTWSGLTDFPWLANPQKPKK